MDSSEFKALVEKYKRELMKVAGKQLKEAARKDNTVYAVEDITEPSEGTDNRNTNSQDTPQNQGQDSLDIDQGYDMAIMDESSLNIDYKGTYQEFIDNNKQLGFLKVQAFTAQQALPVKDISVEVKRKFSDMEKVFFEGTTDDNGIIDGIVLPAPPRGLSEHPNPSSIPFASYEFSASHPVYTLEYPKVVQVFEGIKSIQPVRPILSPENNVN